MKFVETEILGAYRIEAEPHVDARGAFARLYCPEEFEAAGLGAFTPLQVNLSRNPAERTLRGMHYQDPPQAEAKLIRVARGAAYDVLIDLRPNSPTRGRWTAARLDAERMTALFAPEGCAHGFLTLEPDTDVLYQMGRMFAPGLGRGVRYDDPAFGVDWPAEPAVIAEKDRAWPLFAGWDD